MADERDLEQAVRIDRELIEAATSDSTANRGYRSIQAFDLLVAKDLGLELMTGGSPNQISQAEEVVEIVVG
jgi:hypothetical protein